MESRMKIAVTYEDGNVFQHFGRTEYFKVYEVENGTIAKSVVVDTNGKGHGALAEVLKELQVKILICGGIGAGARQGLNEVGIEIFGGVSGNTDQAVEEFLKGTLSFNPDNQCEGHEGGAHGTCGGHSCKGH